MKTGIIYIVTSPSNKVYIGQTTKGLEVRKKGHFREAGRPNSVVYNTKFGRAIRKYGNQLKWEILANNVDIQKLSELEISYIEQYNAFKTGYNSTPGGDGLVTYNKLDEVRVKKSKKLRGSNNPMYGRRHTKAARKKMSEAHLKNPVIMKGYKHTEVARQRMSKAQKGKKLTEEHKAKIGKTNRGKKRSDKFKKLMSEYAQKRVGEKNTSAKLTAEDVRNIRKLKGTKTALEIAKQFGVTKHTIHDIMQNRSWKHIK